ncbi:F-box/FBD/LRR-repeat protein At1g16930-like [Vicia villosa]|uniref:F-box/FBD/LRR-repeat protein At1g16930-like n=1 Tax=Vicia villosa TaxID=3911 RepID=UPI00273AE125|nr:F-box/FBD/LRR-repeat protein At1g16930-like [Vicia villosa]
MADRISTLPETIICLILSFLQTKQSAATSILSKRWKNIWLSVPVLDFRPTRITDATTNFRFNDFAYSIFISRDPALSIKSFSLHVKYKCGYINTTGFPLIPSFTKWLNYVLQRGVKHLNLDVATPGGLPLLPISIFTCRTLVVLHLTIFWVQYSFSSVELPLLQTRNIQFITFPEDVDFMLLLDGCPILEKLFISNVFSNCQEDSLLNSNKWKNFSLGNLIVADVDFSYFRFPFKTLQNVRSLSIKIAKEHVRIDAIPTFHILTYLINCPIDLKEAVSSVIFATPRCSDIPKLADVKKHMASKYGKEFVSAAVELRPDCGVNRLLVEKFSAKAPDGPTNQDKSTDCNS